MIFTNMMVHVMCELIDWIVKGLDKVKSCKQDKCEWDTDGDGDCHKCVGKDCQWWEKDYENF